MKMKILKKILAITTLGLVMTGANIMADDINTHIGATGTLTNINDLYQIQNSIPSGISFKDSDWTALKEGSYDINFELQRDIEFSLNWKGPNFTLTINDSAAMLPTENWKLIFFVDNSQLEEHTIAPGVNVQQFTFNTINLNAKSLKAEIQLNGKTVAIKDLVINDDYGFNPDSLKVSLDDKKSYHFNVADEVLVEYVDTSGNKLSTDDIMVGDYSNNYSTSPRVISGYSLVKVEGNEQGVYDFSKHLVKYVYKKNELAPGLVNIHYQDVDGNKLASDEQKTGTVGSAYSTDNKIIKGYTLKEIKGEASGNFSSIPKDIYYIYEKIVEETTTDNHDKGSTSPGTLNDGAVERKMVQPISKQKNDEQVVKPKKEVLPETGSSDSSLFIGLGGTLIATALAVSLLKNLKEKY